MEVAIPSMDFDFNNTRSSTLMSSPATPRGFGYFSAPTSPSRASEFYREFDAFCMKDEDATVLTSEEASPATLSSDELTETPRFHHEKSNGMDDFSFAFKVVQDTSDEASKSAEELFDGGKIKPTKPPPLGSREILKKSQEGKSSTSALSLGQKKSGQERGRERVQSTLRLGRRPARSLSPSKASEYQWVDEQEQPQESSRKIVISSKPPLHSSSSSSSSTFFKMSKLKDFLLFRSASEGRAADNDPLKKYTSVCKQPEFTKSGSVRSTDSNGLRNGSRKRTQLSPHELHYMKNRAAAEDLKRKTFLPYKQCLFGRMFF